MWEFLCEILRLSSSVENHVIDKRLKVKQIYYTTDNSSHGDFLKSDYSGSGGSQSDALNF